MKSRPRKRRARDPFTNEMDVACCTEATGLVPAMPEGEDARRNLLALYAIRSTPRWDGRES